MLAQYAFEEGYTKVAVIDQLGDDYSMGLANFFIKHFTELGGEIVTEQQFQTNQSDFKAILTEVKASGAEAIFAPSSITTAPLLIKQARELGIEAPFMAGDTWYNTTIIDNAAPRTQREPYAPPSLTRRIPPMKWQMSLSPASRSG